MAKPVVQLTTRGSAVTVRSFTRCRWLLVVLSLGCDPRPLDEGNVSETCEIGGQGTSICEFE